MQKNVIKIGCAPTRRTIFSVEEAVKYKQRILTKLAEFEVEIVDLDDINSEGLLFDGGDLEKAAEKFKTAGVDGMFFPHCNFGSEDLVAKLAKLVGKPVLLWGPRDDSSAEDGGRTRDTQCGLFATGKVLRRFNIPFSYITNSNLDDAVFTKGFENFVSACAVVSAFRKLKILQIGPRPASFWTMICNEGELLEKFGIEVYPITLQDVATETERIRTSKSDTFLSEVERLKTIFDCSAISFSDLERIVSLKLMIKTLCIREGCTAAAIQCWTALQNSIGIMPCAVNGLLFDEGIPVACETDIHGAISSVLLQEAARRSSPVFLADLTVRHPTNDNAELLWHCGNFPPSLAKCGSPKTLGRHFVFTDNSCGCGEWEMRGGDITVCRFDGDHGEYSLFIGEGSGVEGPKTKGTYVWFEVKDWPKWEEKLVTGPYVHHCSGVHAKVAAVLYEACRFIPGLQADLADPTEEEILKYLRSNEVCI